VPHFDERAACSTGRDTAFDPEGDQVADNAQFLHGLYEAFAQGGAPTVLAAMDPGIEWNEAEHGTFWPGHSFIGPEAVLEGVSPAPGQPAVTPSVSKSAASSVAAR
jgi:hypothetical protein